MTPRLRLVYFPVRAKCESIRMALKIGDVKYEDLSIEDFFGKGWGEGAKAETAFGGVPLLVVNDEPPLAQSGAIMRYVVSAIVPSLTPSDPLVAARCDQFFEASQELCTSPTNVNMIANVFRGEDFEQKKKTYFELSAPMLANLERSLAAAPDGGPFFLGQTLYYCDLGIFHALDLTRTLDSAVLDAFPKLQAFMAAVESQPAVAEYLKDRPELVDIGTAPKLQPRA